MLYEVITDCFWYDWHKAKHAIYFGCWAFEAALITVLYELDDSSYRDMRYYPKDRITSYNVCYTKLLRQGCLKGPITKINGMLCLVPIVPKAILAALIPTLEILLEAGLPRGFAGGNAIALDGLKQGAISLWNIRFWTTREAGITEASQQYTVITSYSIHYTKLYDGMIGILIGADIALGLVQHEVAGAGQPQTLAGVHHLVGLPQRGGLV